jgi:hypothetical protein
MTLGLEERGSYVHSHGTTVFLKSHSDQSQDAVAHAAFNEKRWVWVEDADEAYVAGHILQELEDGQSFEVALSSGSVRGLMFGLVNHFLLSHPSFFLLYITGPNGQCKRNTQDEPTKV